MTLLPRKVYEDLEGKFEELGAKKIQTSTAFCEFSSSPYFLGFCTDPENVSEISCSLLRDGMLSGGILAIISLGG